MAKYQFCSVFAPYIQKFIDAKEAMGFSRKHFEEIFKGVDIFFIKEQISTPFITQSLIAKWREAQVNDNVKTTFNKCSVISQFAKYMNRLGFPCFVPRLPKCICNNYIPYIFTHEQIQTIFATCDSLIMPNRASMDNRLFAIPSILRLLYSTGMRVGEAVSLLNRDVDIVRRLIVIRKTKNQQQRLMPINPSLYQVLHQYLSARNRLPVKNTEAEDAPFFISPSGHALIQGHVYAWFRKILKKCGIPHCADQGPRVHDLRHTCAVHSLMSQVKAGADVYCVLPVLSVFLGHRRLSGTENYVRLTQEMFPDVIKQEQSISQSLFPSLSNICIEYEK
jgi:site-specific recombinase XerD